MTDGVLDVDREHSFAASMTVRVDAPAEHVRSWQYGDEFGVEAEASLDPTTVVALAQADDAELSVEPDPTDWLCELVSVCGSRAAIDYFAVRVLGLAVDRWADARDVRRVAIRENVRDAEGALDDAE